MSIKLKAIGLSLIAALAVSAVSVMGASATTGGSFTGSEHHIILHGKDEATDPTQFTGAATVECGETTYTGTVQLNSLDTTVKEVTVFPHYNSCTSTFGASTVKMNGCHYTFTVKSSPETGHNTVHLNCEGKSAGPEIVTPTCTITITPNQTPSGGITYTNKSGDITGDVTAEGLHATYSPAGSFGCAFASTTSTAKMHGSAMLEGLTTTGTNVNIEAK